MLKAIWKELLISFIVVIAFSTIGVFVCNATTITEDFESYGNGELLDDLPWYSYPAYNFLQVSSNEVLFGVKSLDHTSALNEAGEYRFATSSEGTISFWFYSVTPNTWNFYLGNNTSEGSWNGLITFNSVDADSIYAYYNNSFGTTTNIFYDFPIATWYQILITWKNTEVYIWFREIGLPQVNVTPDDNQMYSAEVSNFRIEGGHQADFYIDGISIMDTSINDPIETQTEWQWAGDILAPSQQVCFINEICNFWFNYSTNAIGATIYLIDSDEGEFPEFADDSLVLIDTATKETYLNPDIETATTSKDYCLWLEGTDYAETRICGYEIDWVEYDSYIPEMPDFCDDPCYNVATTSDAWYEIMDDIHCGFNKVIENIICPSDDAIEKIRNIQTQYFSQFPLSLLKDFKDLASTSPVTASSTECIAPVVWWTNGEPETIGCFLGQTTFSTGMGNELYSFYWTWANRAIYFLGFMYILWRILRMWIDLPGHFSTSIRNEEHNSDRRNKQYRELNNYVRREIRNAKRDLDKY